ncbi:hemerythrin family protein [Geomonas sp.]|uniref:bacteriohemerythrin n=1 Tax=Geomonas sp. TaxID=2651584 RepID=UPI002B4A9BC5|nr:hemerythrin family protein [Geomonas sp.]HJV36526.1 hemerythrin family protein [Geomonas sp.]
MAEWQDSLSIGVSEVDIQHRMLFEQFNTFVAACGRQEEEDAIYRLCWFLEAYALAHFKDEEELMQRVAFPDFEKHRAQHLAFAAEVRKLKKQLKDEGPQQSLVSAITNFMAGWLVRHVSTMDKALGKFMADGGMTTNF